MGYAARTAFLESEIMKRKDGGDIEASFSELANAMAIWHAEQGVSMTLVMIGDVIRLMELAENRGRAQAMREISAPEEANGQ